MIVSAILAAILGWALVNVPVATFRAEPRQGAELETQAPLGTPLQLLDDVEGEWHLAMLPDSVVAWVNESAFVELSDSEMGAWRKSPRHIVVSFDEVAGYDPQDAGMKLTSLVNGSIVEHGHALDTPADKTSIMLPDGRECLVDSATVTDFFQWSQLSPSIDRILDFAYSMMDTPYLWGGTSTKMNDCSGFTRICYQDGAGVLLPRNSRQQALAGRPVEMPDTLSRGDLLFFLNPRTLRVNHVGIYDHDGLFIHSSGCVHVNHLDPADPRFSGKIFSHAVRIIDPATGKPFPEIVRIADHPWFF